MVRKTILSTLGLALLATIFAIPLYAQSFSTIQLTPRLNPEGWENARRYEIGFFAKNGEELEEIDLPNQVKVKEIDFVLAGIVKELLVKEYDSRGFKVDNQQVSSTTTEEILALAATNYPSGSPRWDPTNQTFLRQYLLNFPQSLMLYKMEIRGTTPAGTVEETVPLIIRVKQTPAQRDLLTLFFVTTRKAAP